MTEQTCSNNLPRPPASSREAGLRKMGVSESDVALAQRLLGQISSAERILERDKALKLLGATEEDVATENAKWLGKDFCIHSSSVIHETTPQFPSVVRCPGSLWASEEFLYCGFAEPRRHPEAASYSKSKGEGLAQEE